MLSWNIGGVLKKNNKKKEEISALQSASSRETLGAGTEVDWTHSFIQRLLGSARPMPTGPLSAVFPYSLREPGNGYLEREMRWFSDCCEDFVCEEEDVFFSLEIQYTITDLCSLLYTSICCNLDSNVFLGFLFLSISDMGLIWTEEIQSVVLAEINNVHHFAHLNTELLINYQWIIWDRGGNSQ